MVKKQTSNKPPKLEEVLANFNNFTPNFVRMSFLNLNKAGYTAIQSGTVRQEQRCKNCSEFKKVTGWTDILTNTARWGVACPQLKTYINDIQLLSHDIKFIF